MGSSWHALTSAPTGAQAVARATPEVLSQLLALPKAPELVIESLPVDARSPHRQTVLIGYDGHTAEVSVWEGASVSARPRLRTAPSVVIALAAIVSAARLGAALITGGYALDRTTTVTPAFDGFDPDVVVRTLALAAYEPDLDRAARLILARTEGAEDFPI